MLATKAITIIAGSKSRLSNSTRRQLSYAL